MKGDCKMPYKCVAQVRGKLMSAIVYDTLAGVTYPIGEWAEAHAIMQKQGYHLTYFEKLEDALKFTRPGAVWHCEVDGVVEGEIPPDIGTWAAFNGKPGISRLMKWPTGTRMAKRIKLIEKINL